MATTKRSKARLSRTAKPASKTKSASKAKSAGKAKPKGRDSSGTLAQEFMAELDPELAVTRRCVERMPSEKGQFKPHPRSAAMGHLTQLICGMVGVLANIPKGIDLDLSAGPGYSFEQTTTLLATFDKNVKSLRASLADVKPDAWGKTWSVRVGNQILSTASRKDSMRNTINHLVHHRGQLTVYLRLNEVPIPSLYGPSADEK